MPRVTWSRLRGGNEAFQSPFARVRAAVHVQYFTRGERGVGKKQSCVDDFFDLTDPADRVQPFEKVMSFRFMHGSIDHSRRYGVYTNAFLRVFNGEGACHRIQGALQHNLNGRPYTCDRLVNQGS
jgi:hypothetical protein